MVAFILCILCIIHFEDTITILTIDSICSIKNFMKNHKGVVVGCIVAVIVIVALLIIYFRTSPKEYSFWELGATPLTSNSCDSIKNTSASSPVSISFTTTKVSDMRVEVNTLVKKYGGIITEDSFSSYPSIPSPSGEKMSALTSDSLNITATFDKGQAEFLTDLSLLVKTVGGRNTSYTYSDGSQPSMVASLYSNCTDLFQRISADNLHINILARALKSERDPHKLAFIGQMISDIRSNLQSDVNSLNNLFTAGAKPTVTISFTNN